MCLAVPMRVIKKDKDKAVVKSGGLKRDINISLLKQIRVGDYVIVHAGFAIEKVDEKRAKETLDLLKQMRP